VYDVIEIAAPDNKISEVFNGFILFLIVTNSSRGYFGNDAEPG